MNVTRVINALSIPPDARLDQRVPKKLLLEQDIPTADDKRQIQDGIEELLWVAALKPTNIGVPAFRDNVREYLEIAVLTVRFRTAAKQPRLIELIHRAIPYPVVLIAAHGETVSLSLAHKRWSQGEIGKVVIEDVQHGPVSTGSAYGGRVIVSRQSGAFGSAQPRPVCALSGLDRPCGRIGGRPDYRRICPTGFSRPSSGIA